MRILYLVHDLSDPAVSRRIAMFRAGGADVSVAGFRRGQGGATGGEGIVLGHTEDGRFAQRAAAVARTVLTLGSQLGGLEEPRVIVARNLEMLAVAVRAQRFFGGRPTLVYEVLDIHRLLLRGDAAGGLLRRVEGALARRASLLITSSPRFEREYFGRRARFSLPMLLVENKVMDLAGTLPAPRERPRPRKPWRIGWFGMIRCRRSLDLLSRLAAEGKAEVVIRGRPSPQEFPDFEKLVAGLRHVSFLGPYRYPDDLADIYADVDFAWAIDFFEEGANSAWLLPNRLYESCRFGAVPIALREVETGRYLAERGVGILLDSPVEESLPAAIDTLDAAAIAAARERVVDLPADSLVAGPAECRNLVRRLQELISSEVNWEEATHAPSPQ